MRHLSDLPFARHIRYYQGYGCDWIYYFSMQDLCWRKVEDCTVRWRTNTPLTEEQITGLIVQNERRMKGKR